MSNPSPPSLDQIVLADRLALARLSHDHDAILTVIDDVEDCHVCWQAIALHFCNATANLIVRYGDPEVTAQSLTERIAEFLDAIEEEGTTEHE